MCDGGATAPKRCYGVAVFVVCVGLRCVSYDVVQAALACRGLAPAQVVTRWCFSISCCIRLHLLRWRRLAGRNRRRLRSRLSKSEGVLGRTPCGECGEPFRKGGYSLSDTRVAREFLEVLGAGSASLLFSAG